MTRRYSFRIAAVSAALLISAFAPVTPGSAADGSGGCPSGNQTWTGAAKCTFSGRGFPIVFSGTVKTAPPGNNSIRVWITPRNNPEVVLWECRKNAEQYPKCNGGFPDSSTIFDIPFPAQIEKPSFDCYVQGTGSGTYFCHSGSKSAP